MSHKDINHNFFDFNKYYYSGFLFERLSKAYCSLKAIIQIK